jgi:hypothetical protein
MTWYTQVLWVVMAGILGFVIAALFSRRLHLPRSTYVLPYVLLTGGFIWLYFQSSQISLWDLFQTNLIWGVIGAIVVGAFVVRNILSQPASSHATGWQLAWNVVWLGGVYGLIDALLLTIIPVLATWQALSLLGLTATTIGQIVAGIVCMIASLLVTAAYHRGYTEYRGKRLIAPIIGNSVMSLGYLITANPLAAIASHIAMHVAGVLHGPETTAQLPPHYQTNIIARPLA